MEVYEAYSDRSGMQKLVEELVTTVAERTLGTLKAGSAGAPIDLSRPWRETTYRELIREHAGADWFDRDRAAMAAHAQALGLSVDPLWGPIEITQEVYEKLVERTLQNPTFVTRLPAELVPLAKRCPDDPGVVDVFELVIGGKEVAPGYSELNDPIEQRRRFEQQSGADQQYVDEDFLLAMEHGMPPAGGMGIGIDRLVMTLAGCDAIRDVLLFPQLKPRE
ncbi:MAG: amino acid--tRNA ligase-related protein, partial [bacterium]